MNLCVIGVGKIFQNYHLQSILKLDGIKIKYVVDKNEQLVNRIAKRLGAIPLTDAGLIKNCDLCFISTPPSTRLGIFEIIKNKKMHLVFEKPIAFDFETANYIFEESRKMEIKVYVAHTRRFFANINFIRNLIINDFFSFPIKITHFEGGIFNWVTESNYMNSINDKDHGVVHDIGAHVFDYILQIANDLGLKYDDIIIESSVFDFDKLANNCYVKFKIADKLDVTIRISRSIMMSNKLIISDSTKSLISKPGYDNKLNVKVNHFNFEIPVTNEYNQGKDLDDAFDLMWKMICDDFNGIQTNPMYSIESDTVINTSKFIDDVIKSREIHSISNYFNLKMK